MKKLFTALAAIAISASIVSAQAVERGTPVGEWRSWGADTHTTRYSPLDQIDASNFEDLEVAWMWRGDNYSPGGPDPLLRSTPIYVKGKLYSVAGSRRTVVSIDPARVRRCGPSASLIRSGGKTPCGRTTARASHTTSLTVRSGST